jgi:hypothetical protein
MSECSHCIVSGVIKGSEECMRSESGYLTREQYLQVGHRQQSTFSGRRDTIYSLFEVYLKRKKERQDWDAADRFVLSKTSD